MHRGLWIGRGSLIYLKKKLIRKGYFKNRFDFLVDKISFGVSFKGGWDSG